MVNSKRWAVDHAGWLAIAAATLLLQACAEKPPSGPPVRMFAVDFAGAAKTCNAPKATLAAGQATDVALSLGNDGGWCAITVNNGGKPFDAGLLTTPPVHGKVLIHTVGNDTRIDYTPDARFAGADSFTVQLIPGHPTIRASVSVGPS